VRFRRMRHLALFLAAMFFASNAAAAIGACIAELAGQQPMAGHALKAGAGEPAGKSSCPQSDDTGPCLTHYVQSYQSDEQKIWADVSVAALVPERIGVHFPFQVPPKPVVMALAPPVVGPSLTILFRNFRN
jgi:hypothetical protein